MIDICLKSEGGCEGGLTESDYEAGFCTQCGRILREISYGDNPELVLAKLQNRAVNIRSYNYMNEEIPWENNTGEDKKLSKN